MDQLNGRIANLKNKKMSVLKILVRKIKYFFIWIIAELALKVYKVNDKNYWKYFIYNVQARAFLRITQMKNKRGEKK